MLVTLAEAALGLLLLCGGGELLVRGASELASRLRISALAIGLTVVAFGTSAPELVVSLQAALAGANDISVGNVVGSNIANVALILGLAALLRPAEVEDKVVRVDAPLMIGVSFALVAVLADGEASRLEGALLALGLAAYVAFTFWETRRQPGADGQGLVSPPAHAGLHTWQALSLVVLGLALLAGGAGLLVDAAVELATLLGISAAVVGLTVVAVGTSLPELATSLLAAWRGHGSIAIGNVVGSNIFNILGVLGLTALVHPLSQGGIRALDLAVMVTLACVLLVLLATRRQLSRPEGVFLLASYAAYTGWLLSG